MQDFLLVAAVLSASLVVGYPACLLLPANRFDARFIAAPTIGFAALSATIIVSYAFGAPPRMTFVAVSAVGIVMTAVHVFYVQGSKARTPSVRSLAFFTATAGIALLCLLPAWIGGPQFTVFQANVYDVVNAYLPGSVVFHQYDYASVLAAQKGGHGNPIMANANIGLRRPISIVHAAFGGIAHLTTPSSSYAFMVALQINMFFSALFVAINVFGANVRMAILVAAALTVGFFEQYVFDIDAWAQLAAQPIYLIAVAVAVLAFDPHRFGSAPVNAIVRLAAFFCILMTSALLLYPDSSAIYGTAAFAAVCMAMMSGNLRETKITAASGLGIGTAAPLVLACWFGTISFLFNQMMTQALRDLDWWKYFQRYLFGREQIFLFHLDGSPDVSWLSLLNASFSLPVESVIAAVGLYYFLPTSSWPLPLAVIWKLLLYVFVGVLAVAVVRTLLGFWRRGPTDARTRMAAACVAGCLVPIAILATGHYWTAGKAFSMAAPLMFFLIAAPLICAVALPPIGRIACLVVVLGHLLLGIQKPFMARDPNGATMPGLPGSGPTVARQKNGMDWQIDRWAAVFRTCKGVILDVRHPFMNKLAQLVATDIGLPWASLHPINWGYAVIPIYQPAGWERADCIATDDIFDPHDGRKVIWLATDRSVLDFLKAETGILEFGVVPHPGIAAEGVYAFEETARGPLRWTAGDARFVLANSREKPSTSLVLELWPIPLSKDVRLQLRINDWDAFDGPVPSEPLTISLARFAGEERLTVELKTTPVTRYPRDPRELGVALRSLRVEKSRQ